MTRPDNHPAVQTGGIGVLLVLTPWLFGFTGNLAAAWTAWVAGVVIAVTGAVGLVRSWRSHGTQEPRGPSGSATRSPTMRALT